MNRDQLVERLRDTGAEALAAFWSVPPSRLNAGGYENGWTVREIMAHVASMEFTYRRLPGIARSSGDTQSQPGGGTFDMDAYNARQVARRADASQDDLAGEFARGRGVLLVEIAGVDDALLQTPIRSAGGVTGTLAEVIEETAAGHTGAHGSDFARAAGATPTAGERAGAALVIAAEEVAARLDGLSQAEWLRRAAADDWSAAGISGHLIEMMPYWATRIEEIAGKPGATIGRAIDSPERIGAVVDGEAMTPLEAASTLRRAAALAAAILRRIPAESWDMAMIHERYGELSLAGGVNQLLVAHSRDHVRQMAGALAAPIPRV